MKIHVLLKKEELDAQRLPGKTVVVLDILFATSSIVTALAHGAAEVIPTLDGPRLRALRRIERRDPARLRPADAAASARREPRRQVAGVFHHQRHGGGQQGARGRPRLCRRPAQRRGGGRTHRRTACRRDGADRLLRLGRQLQPRGLLRRRLPRFAVRAAAPGARSQRRRPRRHAALREERCRRMPAPRPRRPHDAGAPPRARGRLRRAEEPLRGRAEARRRSSARREELNPNRPLRVPADN
ncbi:MAG: hypothetical protein B6D47_11230 [Rhodocyclaceae bacterium UTPRO2]|nr:MAG: hypothetical protein B6D47_11230 [Rhodocyclaceae bacterium UTPRO2]